MLNIGLACAAALWAASFEPPQEAEAQKRVDWINEHAVAIQSIDPIDDTDFSDLEPLKNMIGNARLVVLGEQSHGDGAVFYAKARLIKFLHQHMGFDVLAWESGMFDCREVDRALRDADTPLAEVKRLGVFPIWTYSAQVTPTLEYVRATMKTDRPTETCGFDHQFSAGGESRWARATIEFFAKTDADLLPAELRESLMSGTAIMSEHDAAKVKSLREQWKKVPALMDEHRAALEQANGADEFAFMRRCADDAVVSLTSMLDYLDAQNNGKVTLNNTRDERMGDNLIWLVNEKYKDRKVIAWMATMHAVHDVQAIKPLEEVDMYAGALTCGTVAHKKLADTTYTIGFTAADGKAGNIWARAPWDLAPPSAGSLEDLCLKTGKPFLFIDFKSLPADHWLRGEIVARPLGYMEMNAQWPKQMDAMFYIQTMFPSTQADMLPVYAKTRADQK